MTTSALVLHGRSLGLDRWWLPFLWIALVPALTLPLSLVTFSLLEGERDGAEIGLPADDDDCGWFCVYEYFEQTDTAIAVGLPGLLNLIPAFWIVSRQGTVRAAAGLATMLGILRVCIALAALVLFFDAVASRDGTTYLRHNDFASFFPGPFTEVWLAGFLPWLGSVLVWVAFGFVTRRRGRRIASRISAGDQLRRVGD